jgi:hypothetical protein
MGPGTRPASSAQGPQGRRGEIIDALAVQDHLAGGDVEQAQDAAADRGFATADSPTNASVSPLSMANDMPSTALTVAALVPNRPE